MKQLPLHQIHVDAEAKFGPFGGYDMPLFYATGTIREHNWTRESASLFDISHMVPVEITGENAASLLAQLCPYPAREHPVGRSRYTFFLNDQAGVIDDLIVSRLADDRFLVVCNAACAEKDLEHIRHHAPRHDTRVAVSQNCFLALQGPRSETVLAAAGIDGSGHSFLDVTEPRPGWLLARSGYTGEDGFEISIPADEAPQFVRTLLRDERLMLAGLSARDTLRLEAGLPLYGQDLSAEITPMEAGLAWAIPKSHREGGEFVGAVALAQKFLAGRARRRIGLKPDSRSPLRSHAEIFDSSNQRIGEITSGGFGPTAGCPIAFGLVKSEFDEPIHSQLRGKDVDLQIVPLPFVPHRYKK